MVTAQHAFVNDVKTETEISSLYYAIIQYYYHSTVHSISNQRVKLKTKQTVFSNVNF